MIANYKQAVSLAKLEPEINYIEYIQTSGSQYIDTGYKPNNNTRVVMDVQPLKSGTFPVFGARRVMTQDSYVLWLYDSSRFRTDFGSQELYVNVSNVLSRVLIDKNKRVCSIGSTKATNNAYTFQTPCNLFLLGQNTNGEVDNRKLSAKLYSCQIYDNDVLVRDYAPALDPERTPCLYDKVSEQYYYNSGSGSFTTP